MRAAIWSAVALGLAGTVPAAGQVTVLDSSGNAPTQALLVPLASEKTQALFAANGAALTPAAQIGLVVAAANGAPTIGEAPPGNVSIEFGFNYVQPNWSNTNFRSLFPGNVSAFFPNTALPDSARYDFGFAPKVDLNYQFSDSNFGLTASGEFLNLKGSLRQVAGTGAATETLDSTASITVINANILEFSYASFLRDLALFKNCCAIQDGCLENAVVELSVGSRYGSLEQNFTADLRRNGDSVTSNSRQQFSGVGVTGAVNFGLPISERVTIYSRNRLSILLGTDTKQADYTLNLPMNAAADASNTVSESRSASIPVGDLEAGIVWHAVKRSTASAAAVSGAPRPLVWLKTGFNAEIWGNVGMLAAGAGPTFRTGNLALLGFTLQLGVER